MMSPRISARALLDLPQGLDANDMMLSEEERLFLAGRAWGFPDLEQMAFLLPGPGEENWAKFASRATAREANLVRAVLSGLSWARRKASGWHFDPEVKDLLCDDPVSKNP